MRLAATQTVAQAHTTVTVLVRRLSDHPHHLQRPLHSGLQPNQVAYITEIVPQLVLPARRRFAAASRGMVRIWTGMVMVLHVSESHGK